MTLRDQEFLLQLSGRGLDGWCSLFFHFHLVDWRMGLSFFLFLFSLTYWFDIQEEVKVLGPLFFFFFLHFLLHIWSSDDRRKTTNRHWVVARAATEGNEGAHRAWIWLERMTAVAWDDSSFFISSVFILFIFFFSSREVCLLVPIFCTFHSYFALCYI